MNKPELIQRLHELATRTESGDEEDWHIEADDLIAEFLISLGHSDVVEVYNRIDKWYA